MDEPETIGDKVEKAMGLLIALRNILPDMKARGMNFTQAQLMISSRYDMSLDRAEWYLEAAERIAKVKLERGKPN
jgi:hypothetical protein